MCAHLLLRQDKVRSFKSLQAAINLLYGKIVQDEFAQWPETTLFVTYCVGPHCDGADRGALNLAKLGRPVKSMAGGITGWIDEAFEQAKSGSPA
jgi:rhodanese-related sulfurtransferase